jgi:N-acyl-phosphatidylethanolamine-hydrolysing phospholipase D
VCAGILAVLLLLAGVTAAHTVGAPSAAHRLAHGFRNLDPAYSYSMAGRIGRLVARLGQASRPRGAPLSPVANDGSALRANGAEATVTWVGHATFLIQLEGVNIVTDPHWGERASPVRFAGPRRMVPAGLRFDDLPPVHAVIVSHDHYDHLDRDTIRRIARAHDALFIVPLGLGPLLADMGARRVVELDWWESTSLRSLTVVCAPAQHSSGRTLADQDERLWSSWAVLGSHKRLFFAGDTGYFSELREIGARLGPFGLALVPIGGYSSFASRHPNHVNPEEAVQLSEDVGAQRLVPMHWGTFDMNVEPFAEPPTRLVREAERRGWQGRVTILDPGATLHW